MVYWKRIFTNLFSFLCEVLLTGIYFYFPIFFFGYIPLRFRDLSRGLGVGLLLSSEAAGLLLLSDTTWFALSETITLWLGLSLS